MRERRVYAGAAAGFDTRRNSSAVRPPSLAAVAAAAEERRRRLHDPPAWHKWIVKRQRGEHDHASLRENGGRSACPVPGCTEPLTPEPGR